eukprot:s158_g2.t1
MVISTICNFLTITVTINVIITIVITDSLLTLLRSPCPSTQETTAAGLRCCIERGGKAPVEARECLAAALAATAQSDERNVREESATCRQRGTVKSRVRALGCLGSAANCEQTGRGGRRSRLQCRIFETVLEGLEDVSVAVQRAAMEALGVLHLPRQALP